MLSEAFRRRSDEALLALVFLTRLPWRRHRSLEGIPLAGAVWAFPLIGCLVGAMGGLLYAIAAGVGLSAGLAAVLAVLGQVVLTGGLHEDGLADSADGLGGRDRAHRLAIMRDSQIGSYGVLALVFSVAARIAALVALADPWLCAGALVATGAVSRAAMASMMLLTKPARQDGLGASAGRPGAMSLLWAWVIALAVSAWTVSPEQAVVVAAAAIAVCVLIGGWSRRRLGGYTGDVLGAGQQVAECGGLIVLVAAR